MVGGESSEVRATAHTHLALWEEYATSFETETEIFFTTAAMEAQKV